MPPAIAAMIGVAARVTLYLLGQNGPTSFVFKDRLDSKYKVSIGSCINCSCSPGRNDHCLHSIYVMTRLFSIPPDNPLVWQPSYLDSQLTDIVAGKYSQARRRVPALEEYMFQRQTREESETFGDSTLMVENNNQVEPMKLTEESSCPICQEDMKPDMLLTHCKVSCGNNFHLNCVKIWVEHKVSTNAAVTCPMCRCDWGRRILSALSEEQARFKVEKKRAQIESKAMQFDCKGCGIKKIPQPIFKCILCQDFCLCEGCYLSNKHNKHPFIVFEKEGWHGAPERRERQKKIQDFLNKKRRENLTDQLADKLAKINQDPAKLLDFLASAYPYVSKYISDNLDPYKNLDLGQDNMKCMCCGSSRMIYLRRLNCGHYVDHNCLKQCINKGTFYCNVDGNQFLKGYQSLMKRKQEMEIELANKTKYSSEVGNKKDKQMYNFNFGDEQDQTLHDILGEVMRSVGMEDHPMNQRLKRKINGSVMRPQQASHSASRQDPHIRIRNVQPTNHRRPPLPASGSQIPPRPRPPSSSTREKPTRAASLGRRQPEESAPRLSIQGIVARRLAQH